RHDLPVDRSAEDRARAVRSRAGRSDVDHLLPDHPVPELAVLHVDDAQRGTLMRRPTWLIPAVYIVFLILPIYWLLNMSFKSTNEILGSFTLWPRNFTLDNYAKILTEPVWYSGYINSISYVLINTVISVVVALPAAYAFSRYRFLGDKHLFFWLLTNR